MMIVKKTAAYISSFIKKETVFCIACACAVISSFFVHPSAAYISYIDFNTLAMLFCLMTTVAGLEKCGVFKVLGEKLCAHVSSVRSLSFVLVLLPFFISMFITNDVSLITFVPFALLLLCSQNNLPGWIPMYVVVLQTVAANTGSMLTPIGNPQNLFIYGKTGMSLVSFLLVMMPYTALCACLLVVSIFFVPNIKLEYSSSADKQNMERITIVRIALYGFLFVCCLLAVVHIIPKFVLVPVVLVSVIIADYKTLLSVDYVLLLTFTAFFIFTGNIGAIAPVRQMLETTVQNNECAVAVAASQIISNVPATLLLYPFSQNVESLLIGVNVGGLGTLVASLASLISFKIYTRQNGKAAKYLLFFTIINCIYLALLLVLHAIIR